MNSPYHSQSYDEDYLMGQFGTNDLQPDDFYRLGFSDPEMAYDTIAPIHKRVMDGWESNSRYDGYHRGPDASKVLSSTAFKPLESLNQDDIISWYDNFASVAESYRMALIPFAQIVMTQGYKGLCPPGVGKGKFNEMGRVMSLLLTTKLLPMDDDSELSHALKLAKDKTNPNGYKILHMLLKKTVPAFDEEQINLTWPTYAEYDNIFKYAEAIQNVLVMSTKRNRHVDPKVAATDFLNTIIQEAGERFRLEAELLKRELKGYPEGVLLPEKYEITNMAYEISKSKKKEPTDPDLSTKHRSIYKAAMGQPNDKAIQANHSIEQQRHEPNMVWNDNMQGFNTKRYCVNEMYRPSKESSRRPQRRPVPDASKKKKNKSSYDSSMVCDACGMRGHAAVRCFTLASYVYAHDYIANGHEEEVQQAVKHWKDKNAPYLKDDETGKQMDRNPVQVLRTYMERYGHNLDTIRDQLDWEYFDHGSDESEVFGGTMARFGGDESN